jgi:1-acyl-sn-glycerol-3-phosphate acyltransferase
MNTQRSLVGICTLLARVLFRPRIGGTERIPAAGGFVLAANHLSGFDSFALALLLGRRRMRCMAKNQLFAHPVLGPLVRLLGAFPAQRNRVLAGGVAEAARLAAAGDVVVIFPEGCRRRGRTGMRPKSGAARTACAAGVPIVPVAIRGTDGWRRLARWSIVVGEPITSDQTPAEPPALAARRVTARLWTAVTELEASLDAGTGPS